MSDGESSDSESDLLSRPTSTAPTSFASGSILLNPLPPPKSRSKTCLVSFKPRSSPITHSVSLPEKPPLLRASSTLSSDSVVIADDDSTFSIRSCNTNNRSGAASGTIQFAPLPPGRSRFRSNSLTIGVAARAKMIASQGGGAQLSRSRHAGPQQWYQPGGTLPPDVYTYKDATAAINKVWQRCRKKPSSTQLSTAAAAALAVEKEGKGDQGDQEMIEDIAENEEEIDSQSYPIQSTPDSRPSHYPTHSFRLTEEDDGGSFLVGSMDSSERSEAETELSTPDDSDLELGSLIITEHKGKSRENVPREAVMTQAML